MAKYTRAHHTNTLARADLAVAPLIPEIYPPMLTNWIIYWTIWNMIEVRKLFGIFHEPIFIFCSSFLQKPISLMSGLMMACCEYLIRIEFFLIDLTWYSCACSEPHSRTVHSSRTVTKSGGVAKPLSSPTLVRRTLNQQEARQRSRSPNYQSHIESQITRDVAYDSDPVPDPNYSTQRSYNYSKTSDTKRSGVPYATDIVEVETSELPPELRSVPSDILPQPGTKVTTTVSYLTQLQRRADSFIIIDWYFPD